MPESYQPGRRNKLPKQASKGDYAESRYAWARIEQGQFVILVHAEPEDQSESGPDIVLLIQRSKLNFSTILSAMTEEELDAVEDILSSAIKWARPICQLRDKEANDAWEQGDDTRRRSYRAVPQLVYRKRPEPQYSQGLSDGPEDVSSGSGGADHLSEPVRKPGQVLPEQDQGRRSPEDDIAEADES